MEIMLPNTGDNTPIGGHCVMRLIRQQPTDWNSMQHNDGNKCTEWYAHDLVQYSGRVCDYGAVPCHGPETTQPKS